MSPFIVTPCTAFAGTTRIAQGPLVDVALALCSHAESDAQVLVFDNATGEVIDLDLRGNEEEIVARLEARSQPASCAKPAAREEKRRRGRPKLGVVGREVTLLPRHWEWLERQPGGASQTLRRLVEDARKADQGQTQTRAAREATYRFIAAMAGDLPGFEEATRALFAGARRDLERHMKTWPDDVRAFALELADG